ncbi:MAG: GNAT family N-acetyltransferase [Oscillospiraceae bacterium]|nr:GNAT family N-acetyltransferase [Oscillospiraceae bacterium]
MEVKRARPEEKEAVYRLICRLEGRRLDRETFFGRYLGDLCAPDVCFLTAEGPEGTIGFLSLYFHRYLHHDGEVAEIGELAVEADARGKGVGSALFHAAKQEAARRGCETLEVHCGAGRGAAHSFYRGRGMEESHKKFTLRLE